MSRDRSGNGGERKSSLPPQGAGALPSRDLASLVDTYYLPLYRFGLALTSSETDAAELTQQTFYIWARKGHQLRDASKAKVWLFTVLRREFLKSKRYQARFVSDDGALDLAATEERAATPAVDHLDGNLAQEMLLGLDETYRQPLVLFYLQQLSYREIAEILEVPIGTVMSRIWRGKLKLRKLLVDRRGGDCGRSFEA